MTAQEKFELLHESVLDVIKVIKRDLGTPEHPGDSKEVLDYACKLLQFAYDEVNE